MDALCLLVLGPAHVTPLRLSIKAGGLIDEPQSPHRVTEAAAVAILFSVTWLYAHDLPHVCSQQLALRVAQHTC